VDERLSKAAWLRYRADPAAKRALARVKSLDGASGRSRPLLSNRHSPNISISSKVSRFRRFRRDRSGRDRQAQTPGRVVLSPSAADDLNSIVPAID
jgi:hypothetical protein